VEEGDIDGGVEDYADEMGDESAMDGGAAG